MFHSTFACISFICISRFLKNFEVPRKLNEAENLVFWKEANTKLVRKWIYFGFFIVTSYIKQFMFNRITSSNISRQIQGFVLSCDELLFTLWQNTCVVLPASHPLSTVTSQPFSQYCYQPAILSILLPASHPLTTVTSQPFSQYC
jgi:uncharacterized membrane protein (DUF485 family)